MRRYTSMLFGMVLMAASCSKPEPMEAPDEYGITDTVTHIHPSIFPNWNFTNTRPVVLKLGFHKYRFDSTFAWDPFSQTFVEWMGVPVNGWHYDYREFGKYQIHIPTDTLIDISKPAFDDVGSYLYYEPNINLINKPVAKIFDTVAGKIAATLILGERSYISIDLDTGRYRKPIPNRPPSQELAKTLNQCFKAVAENYRFIKFKPR